MIHPYCRTEDNLALDSRRLIWAAAEAVSQVGEETDAGPLRITDWPAECPDITASVERFFPTAILLRDLEWSDEPDILVDRSLQEFSGFITAIYMAESVENFDWGRLKIIAGRTFFQPPTLPDEDEKRFELMAALRKGLPMREELGFQPRMLHRRLEGIDHSNIFDLNPAEQLALVTVIASNNGQAAFFSEAGDWPRSITVQIAAAFNNCRIHRLTLEGIPEESLQRIRNSRYEAPEGPI